MNDSLEPLQQAQKLLREAKREQEAGMWIVAIIFIIIAIAIITFAVLGFIRMEG